MDFVSESINVENKKQRSEGSMQLDLENNNKLVEETKAAARIALAKPLQVPKKNLVLDGTPIDMLMSYPWQQYVDSGGKFNQKEVREMDRTFDLRMPFGRAVLALLLVEKYFTDANIQMCEVKSDKLQEDILKSFNGANGQTAMKAAEELLAHAPLRIVFMVGGRQFDPSLVKDGKRGIHSSVQMFPAWEFVAAYSIVNANAECEDDQGKVSESLAAAESICPGTNLVLRNKAIQAIKLQDTKAFNTMAEKAVIDCPSAALCFVVWKKSASQKLQGLLQKIFYPPGLLDALANSQVAA